MRRSFSLPALVLPTLVGCAGAAGLLTPGAAGPTTIEQDATWVVLATVEVFNRTGIPVAERDEFGGVVRSGVFRVQRSWNGEAVSRRIDCPLVQGAPEQIYSAPFDVEVTARSRPRSGLTSDLSVFGQARRVVAPDGQRSEQRCVLREEFRAWLVDAIRREAMAQPPRGRAGW